MAADLFTEEEKNRITEAIKEAELNTSGEIRVHIERKCKEDVLDRAAYVFEELDMHETELRNGVLFYLAVDDRQLAILGDAGINKEVPEGFWDNIRDLMVSNFKEGKFTEGLAEGIKLAGQELKAHFPYATDDVNELDDDISFGE